LASRDAITAPAARRVDPRLRTSATWRSCSANASEPSWYIRSSKLVIAATAAWPFLRTPPRLDAVIDRVFQGKQLYALELADDRGPIEISVSDEILAGIEREVCRLLGYEKAFEPTSGSSPAPSPPPTSAKRD
jgi:hypothetical protein